MSPRCESFPIAVRAYAESVWKEEEASTGEGREAPECSPWMLVFDTETTADAPQQLRIGVYQLRYQGKLREQGFFFDPLSLSDAERSLLHAYAARHRFDEVYTVAEFLEAVFFKVVYRRNALCIGFNLPFDLSRVAIDHCSARTLPSAFSLQLWADPKRPRLQIKHLNSRAAIIQFTAPMDRTSRSERQRGEKRRVRRGHFLDVRTLAGALLAGSWSLGTLAQHLETEHQKLGTDEHGGQLTQEYLEYAVNDVQVTWECFEALQQRYERYGLTKTRIDQIYSEASLGKACLRQMGIRRWWRSSHRFPPELLGKIMRTYYGGRSEVRWRRVIRRVLYCDFLSMYPTVCTLMGLWRFVIAERVAWREEVADEVQAFLDRTQLEDWQHQATWTQLPVIVEVEADGGLFPLRAPYDGTQYTIGENYLHAGARIWYTLGHCVASKLRTGKTPKVLRAIRFEPVGMQEGLQPFDIAGNPDYRIDPHTDDFYKRLIDLRARDKDEAAVAEQVGDEQRARRLETEAQALKILANATSYGIFAELNVHEETAPQEVRCFGGEGSFTTRVHNVEEPGSYFHPLLATLITGAARLMLALVEQLAANQGIDWAFCDTDSMALVRPEGMSEEGFVLHARTFIDWFTALNPYEKPGSLLKIEQANYRLQDGKPTTELDELFCYAIAAKRYALFNLDGEGKPVLRKASGHGLGHLLDPYTEDDAPADIPAPVVSLKELGVGRWEYDVWYRIVEAALEEHPDRVRLDDLPEFDQPALSRYAATTPQLLRWFRRYNEGRPYREQVRPFGFLLAFQQDPMARGSAEELLCRLDEAEGRQVATQQWQELRGHILHEGGIKRTPDHRERMPRSICRKAGLPPDVMADLFGYDYVDDFLGYVWSVWDRYRSSQRKRRSRCRRYKPVAPYDRDPAVAARTCFDRQTGEPVAAEALKNYRQALSQYHLHPESKFRNGDYLDTGRTEWRHVVVERIEHIGKEADRWEEQFYLGLDAEAAIEYGMAPDDLERVISEVVQACHQFGVRKVAAAAGLSHTVVSRLLQGHGCPRPSVLVRLQRAATTLAAEAQIRGDRSQSVLRAAE